MKLDQFNTVLAFFAHPDDETLAAGATIHKLIKMGVDVHVAIPATGIHSRRNVQSDEKEREQALAALKEDCKKAVSILGVKPENLHLGDFPDNEMDKHSLLEVIHWLESVVDKVKPDLVLTHHRFCTNIDHQYCHEAAIVATRPSIDQHITVLCGEVPSSTGYLKPSQFEPNFFVAITQADLDAKTAAMECYEGEARQDPHPRSKAVLEAVAKVRGSESGNFFAEAFMVSKLFA